MAASCSDTTASARRRRCRRSTPRRCGRFANAIACSARFRFNTGGPRSRTRTQHIGATVLGTDRGSVSCPLVISLALDFGKRDPLVAV